MLVGRLTVAQAVGALIAAEPADPAESLRVEQPFCCAEKSIVYPERSFETSRMRHLKK